jgi:hypothetical protein
MRLILAVVATTFAACATAPTAAYALKTAQSSALGASNPAAARASLNDNYNKCVSLAKSRGYTESDLDGNRAAARNFVVRCMQGRQH